MSSSRRGSAGSAVEVEMDTLEADTEGKAVATLAESKKDSSASVGTRNPMLSITNHASLIDDDSDSEGVKGPLTLKQRVFQLFEEPQSSNGALAITLFIMFLIVFSTVSFCIETLPEIRGDKSKRRTFFILESIAISFFTLEYLIRVFTCPDPLTYVKMPLNVIDALAILPYYIEVIVGGGGVSGLIVVRVIRLARVFRIFKFSRYSTAILLVSRSLQRSTDALGLLVFLVMIAVTLFSSMLYFAEQTASRLNDNDEWVYKAEYSDNGLCCDLSPFQSIPDTFWWCIVTITTVGYGDAFPRSGVGKIVAVLTMLSGLIIIAFPITIIGTNFADVWTESRSKKLAQQEKEALRAIQRGMSSVDLTILTAKEKELADLSRDIARKQDAIASDLVRRHELQALIQRIKSGGKDEGASVTD